MENNLGDVFPVSPSPTWWCDNCCTVASRTFKRFTLLWNSTDQRILRFNRSEARLSICFQSSRHQQLLLIAFFVTKVTKDDALIFLPVKNLQHKTQSPHYKTRFGSRSQQPEKVIFSFIGLILVSKSKIEYLNSSKAVSQALNDYTTEQESWKEFQVILHQT